jgi:hypothetical protein
VKSKKPTTDLGGDTEVAAKMGSRRKESKIIPPISGKDTLLRTFSLKEESGLRDSILTNQVLS